MEHQIENLGNSKQNNKVSPENQVEQNPAKRTKDRSLKSLVEISEGDFDLQQQSPQLKTQSHHPLKINNKSAPFNTLDEVRQDSNSAMMNQFPTDQAQLLDYSDFSSPKGFSNDTWRKKAFNILVHILRFQSIITSSTFTSRFRLITKKIFNIISDKTADFNFYKFNNYLKYEKPSNFEKRWYTFNITYLKPMENSKIYQRLRSLELLMKPESNYWIIWNIYLMFVIIFNVYYIGLKLAFPIQQTSTTILIFNDIPRFSYLLEIILKFNTAFYLKGQLITDRLLIIRNYLTHSFLLDMMIMISYFISYQIQYFDSIVILKVFEISKYSNVLFERFELNKTLYGICDLIKLLFMILFLGHFTACLWYMIGTTNTQQNWLKHAGIEQDAWTDHYLTSFYWSIVTMTTIGYGDITPTNIKERMFCIVITITSCGIFAYSINSIGNIFGELYKQFDQYRNDMNSLKKYLRQKGISEDLQKRVRKYFEYLWLEANEDAQEKFAYDYLIPDYLKDEMIVDINLKILKKIDFLTLNFSEKFLVELSRNMVSQTYNQEEIIYNKNEPCDEFYILHEGEIQFYQENKQTNDFKLIETLTKRNTAFGQLDFFSEQEHKINCRSGRLSHVLQIHREDLITLLSNYPQDFQRYCQLKDRIKFMNAQEEIGITCRACNRSNHFIINCPMITGTPNKTKVLLNYRRNLASDRHKFKRKKTTKNQNTLINQIKVIEGAIHFLICNEEFHEQFMEIKDQLKQYFKDSKPEKTEVDQRSKRIMRLKLGDMPQAQVKLTNKEQKFESYRTSLQRIIEEEEKEITSEKNNNIDLVNFNEIAEISDTSDGEGEQQHQKPHNNLNRQQLHPLIKRSSMILQEKALESYKKLTHQEENLVFGQHVDIFYDFEKMKNWDYYFFHNNFNAGLKQTRKKSSKLLLSSQKTLFTLIALKKQHLGQKIVSILNFKRKLKK